LKDYDKCHTFATDFLIQRLFTYKIMDRFSFLNAAHTEFFANLYEQYLQNPDSVEPSWRAFFQGFDFGMTTYNEENAVQELAQYAANVPQNGQVSDKLQKEFNVLKLIDGYRTRGHLFTQTNPVRERRMYDPNLDMEHFGLSSADLDTVFDAAKVLGKQPCTLKQIIAHLMSMYCQHIGIEYMHMENPIFVNWVQERINKNDNQPSFNAEQKKHILGKLNEAVSFENFLHTKYVGQKRFSLEGGESIIPALDALIESAAEKGVEHFVMGMAHRGRLNTLANIFGKATQDIFSEFDGKDYDKEYFDGDVKYHLGLTSERKTKSGKKININLAPNPSHLETVGAVIEGITRAKQDKIELDKAKTLLTQTEQQLKLEYEKAQSEYEFSIEEYATSKSNLNLAERIEGKQQTKFTEGLSSSFDFSEAQRQLYTAQQNYLQSMVNIINKKAALEKILNKN
jgi:2-oxoglutarate dehydrogenase E1 component